MSPATANRPLPNTLTEEPPLFLPDGRINPEWEAIYGTVEAKPETARVAEEPPREDPAH